MVVDKLEVSERFKGAFGELVYEYRANQLGYAYISLEEIYNTLKNGSDEIIIRKGNRRISHKIHPDYLDEIKKYATPQNGSDEEPHFVFDYFSVRPYFHENSNKITIYHQSYCWIEIKTNKSKLSSKQKKALEDSKIGVKIFKIKFPFPEYIECKYKGHKRKN